MTTLTIYHHIHDNKSTARKAPTASKGFKTWCLERKGYMFCIIVKRTKFPDLSQS